MEPRYRLVDSIDWAHLDGAKVTVGVSRTHLSFELKDGTLLRIATAVRERPRPPQAETTPTPVREADGDEPRRAADG